MQSGQAPHISVLYQQSIDALNPRSPGKYVDGTLGAGGHAAGILEASAPGGHLLGLDVDPQALKIAAARLQPFAGRFTLAQASYASLLEQIRALGWNGVQGILVDLGVSSMQIDTPERGFSFQAEGPLDMRMDPHLPHTAADLVNNLTEEGLAEILWRYGEEQQSRRIARAVLRSRPIHTTTRLAEVILQACGGQKGRIHPATRSFQALRIVVNQELHELEEFLPRAVQALAPGGRLAVISFHSLEDRIIKHFFQHESRDCLCPPQQPVCNCGHRAVLKLINRHPVVAEEYETQENPRSRSAKLRVAEKL